MKTFWNELRSSIVSTLVLAVLLCGVFPTAIWGIGQAAFHRQANGSLIADRRGTVIGSALLAQAFTADRYFQPRPSAAGGGYDATNSGGTNLGPTSKKLSDRIAAAVSGYRKSNGLAGDLPVPADAVTSSASGLDPDISVENAQIQAGRVARARGWSLAEITALIAANTRDRDWGVFGERRVNVLKLNLALDDHGSVHP
ncbi:MAG TPA: K(+)-transporting ATPase subunit C [Opitutaceae bacterium]|jgi:K+-transporting ATPase ATPase C chain